VAVTPGPDSLLVLRNTLRGGRRAGIYTALGAATGSLVWGLGSAAGLTAIIAASAEVFRVVELVGSAYLLLLGLRGLRGSADPSSPMHCAPQVGRTRGFRAGLVSNAFNPKMGLFFLAVMPQFVPAQAAVLPYALAFAAIDALIAFGWLTTAAWIGHATSRWIRRPRTRRALDRVTASVLVGLGANVAAEAFGA
jgi:threonine/homoserine/homoserine lactone efflux protein